MQATSAVCKPVLYGDEGQSISARVSFYLNFIFALRCELAALSLNLAAYRGKSLNCEQEHGN
jgi:hypothetical protein